LSFLTAFEANRSRVHTFFLLNELKMTDFLKNLPEAQEPLSPEEMNMMKDIFQSGQGVGTVNKNFYKPLIYGALFFALSIPLTDKLIRGFIETTDLVLIFVKTAVFIIIAYLLLSFGF
jgi:hypothetical protein